MIVTREFKATVKCKVSQFVDEKDREKLEYLMSKEGLKKTRELFESEIREMFEEENEFDEGLEVKVSGLKYIIDEGRPISKPVEVADESTN